MHARVRARGDPRRASRATAAARPAPANADRLRLPPTCGNGVVDPGETCELAIPRGTAGACPIESDCMPRRRLRHAHLVVGRHLLGGLRPLPDRRSRWTTTAAAPPARPRGGQRLPAALRQRRDGRRREVRRRHPAARARTRARPAATTATACTIGLPRSAVGCQAACQHIPITAPISGRRLLPRRTERRPPTATDSDCPPMCGNGVVEPGETCDGDCPTSCPPAPMLASIWPAACAPSWSGDAATCSARCVVTRGRPRCAARSRTAAALPAAPPPTTRTAPRAAATASIESTQRRDVRHRRAARRSRQLPDLVRRLEPLHRRSAGQRGNLRRRLRVHLPTTAFAPATAAVRDGANFVLDPDCAPMCGNGVVESPGERCDSPPVTRARPAKRVRRRSPAPAMRCRATASTCSATCVADADHRVRRRRRLLPGGLHRRRRIRIAPRSAATAWSRPARPATARSPRAAPGACPRTCDDGNACTLDFASGSRRGRARGPARTARSPRCIDGDGCCPAGCSAASDRDCDPRCGDGGSGAGETCDPTGDLPDRVPRRRRPLHDGRGWSATRPPATRPAATPRSPPARAAPRDPAARPGCTSQDRRDC